MREIRTSWFVESVHAGGTPKDPDLISHFHETLVEANRPRMIQLCEQIGRVLGPGFYAHNILHAEKLVNSSFAKTGFKFDDTSTGSLANKF
jgi:hypothetical protein